MRLGRFVQAALVGQANLLIGYFIDGVVRRTFAKSRFIGTSNGNLKFIGVLLARLGIVLQAGW